MFKNLRITWKLIIIYLSIMLVSGVLISSIVAFQLKLNLKKEIQTVRQEELNRAKERLSNYVDLAFKNIDPENIEKSKHDIQKLRYNNGVGYFWINDLGRPYPRMVMHPTVPALNGKILDDPKYNCAFGTQKNLFQAFVDVCEQNGEGFVDYLWPKPTKNGLTKDQPKLSYVRKFDKLGWIIGTGVYIDSIDDIIAQKTMLANSQISSLILSITIIVAGVIIVSSLVFFLFISKSIVLPLQKATGLADAIAGDDFNQKIENDRKDEIGQLIQSLDIMVEKLRQGRANIEKKVSDQQEILNNVARASSQVATGSGQVLDSSNALAQGATEQASSLEEIVASMSQIGAQTQTNADNASQAKQLAAAVRDEARKGVGQMKETVISINTINESSKEIAKIMKVIDDIAFQTNLLALNASVEAARAGKHGKGFAVVAQEVRTLAGRSAKAAREIEELIDASVKKVDDGNIIAEKTAKALDDINEGVAKVAGLVEDIASASNDQAQGISLINKGLRQVDSVTQQNTTNAEETNAAAEELSKQAYVLQQLLIRFREKDTEVPVPTHNAETFARGQNDKIDPVPEESPPVFESYQLWNGEPDATGQEDRTIDPEQLILLDEEEFENN
ncbi:MAG: methyl-accepting chemotaxis protein [Thermodesulfobacteriota bacterium]|nr:methyl-accepting chemotaxis protein [Thermodesulfobacteriota bacterium]